MNDDATTHVKVEDGLLDELKDVFEQNVSRLRKVNAWIIHIYLLPVSEHGCPVEIKAKNK